MEINLTYGTSIVALAWSFYHSGRCVLMQLVDSSLSVQVAEKILDSRELEFYKWDGDLSQLLQAVREKLNAVAAVNLKNSPNSSGSPAISDPGPETSLQGW